jgi:hypothetical protein
MQYFAVVLQDMLAEQSAFVRQPVHVSLRQ